MRGDADEANTLNEDERDPLVPGDLLRCLTNEVQWRAKRVHCNAGLGLREWSGRPRETGATTLAPAPTSIRVSALPGTRDLGGLESLVVVGSSMEPEER